MKIAVTAFAFLIILAFSSIIPASSWGFFVMSSNSMHTAPLIDKQVVIVGAGPVGLAAALTFSKRGYKDVTVLERRGGSNNFEVEKAYLYLLDSRGLKMIDRLGLRQEVEKQAVSSKTFQEIVEFLPSGKTSIRKLPVLKGASEKFWIPRSALLDILVKECERQREVINKEERNRSLKVLFHHNFQGLSVSNERKISFSPDKGRVTTVGDERLWACVTTNSLQMELAFPADLIIAADGINSKVRSTLEADLRVFPDRELSRVYAHVETLPPFQASHKRRWAPVQIPSPSGGLKFKIISLLPDFPVGDRGLSSNEQGYAIRSTERGNSPLSLGLLPLKKGLQRTANIIKPANHPVWKINTITEAKKFFTEKFPQLNLTSFVSNDELRRFCQTQAGTFPQPQYCPTLKEVFSLGVPKVTRSNRCALLVLGDAAHAFPPDLGQGVNSGLEDVDVLNTTLDDCNDDISATAFEYERRRLPEVKALCELQSFAFPYQYRQNLFMTNLYIFNFLFRNLLHSVCPLLFDQASFYLIQKGIPYTKVLKACKRTTRNMKIVLALAAMSAVVISPLPFKRVVATVVGAILRVKGACFPPAV